VVHMYLSNVKSWSTGTRATHDRHKEDIMSCFYWCLAVFINCGFYVYFFCPTVFR